jgi:hypothetical protein
MYLTVQLIEVKETVRDIRETQFLKAHFEVSNISRFYLPYFNVCI